MLNICCFHFFSEKKVQVLGLFKIVNLENLNYLMFYILSNLRVFCSVRRGQQKSTEQAQGLMAFCKFQKIFKIYIFRLFFFPVFPF